MFHAEHNKEKKTTEKDENINWENEISEHVISDDNVDLITDDVDVEAEVDVDVDVENVPAQKPHFLDYDAVPPPELVENFAKLNLKSTTNEMQKIDKKYERDGEISDFELAASVGFTKKETTSDFGSSVTRSSLRKHIFGKPKHFLDENPIPPDYMLENEFREHRSLDRNFERQVEQQQRRDERKSSLDRGGSVGGGGTAAAGNAVETRLSRERLKSQIQWEGVPRFLNSPNSSIPPPKGTAWTIEYSRYVARPTDLELDSQSVGPRVECVYSLLSMLGSTDPLDMSKKFFELSRSPETCVTLRRSGCIPLLVQMMYSNEAEDGVRKYANMALHNVFHSNPDEKTGRRELKVLRLLDKINEYCSFLKTLLQSGGEAPADDTDRHPLAAISSLMKVSFDEEHRHTMCELGALHAIPNLVHLDHAAHGPKPEFESLDVGNSDEACKPGLSQGRGCNSLRRYALMALTNLTFGDENNKAQLCSQKPFMEALIAQLDSAPDDLLQVTASVLRNLSWRADKNMKSVLNEIGTITALARAAMKNKNENTLKAILSALWNLSAHCSTNKAEFCAVDGALAFLVDMLTYEGPSKTLKIIENAGGILHNVSSHIAVCENYRQILRERNCLAILLQQLKSESLTVVSNSCGTLWNLSARCPEDQKFLWDNGAVPMLRSLIHSKHKMISEGSSSALKNLLNFRPSGHNQVPLDPIARSMGLKKLPTLNARKQRALEQELGDKVHEETCENLDNHLTETPTTTKATTVCDERNFDALYARRLTRSAMLTKSESRDSILSAKSDTTYEHLLRSHSASETNRHKNQNSRQPNKLVPYNMQRAVYVLKSEVETTEDVEQPIDYSVKYNETSNTNSKSRNNETIMTNSANRKARMPSPVPYQETDLDQPTDFSLRYAENQLESDLEIGENKKKDIITTTTTTTSTTVAAVSTNNNNSNTEIMLILEDTVKCYQTEDTPYVISNAASITDLRQVASGNKTEDHNITKTTTNKDNTNASTQITTQTVMATNAPAAPLTTNFTLGSYTPEKPINYNEEGTPGYFSRYDSLSSLDEPTTNNCGNNIENNTETNKPEKSTTIQTEIIKNETLLVNNVPNAMSTNMNSAQETPLMFSRHSSLDSLIAEDEEIVHCDDISSVVSDFSRLASGVISPSEIPDSPTQSMPQSPRRHSVTVEHQNTITENVSNENQNILKTPLRSVFEDDLNTFHVENTPAQFSCATSLSNLSFADDSSPETKLTKTTHSNRNTTEKSEQRTQHINAVSEGEEECNDDAYLLANCINIGMHRGGTLDNKKKNNASKQAQGKASFDETTKQYCTEDTPALLSKVGSNSNLSAISICSKDENPIDMIDIKNEQRQSLNLSDDVSSNASESGAAALSQSEILQQCIRDGMKKKSHSSPKSTKAEIDPIAMMRRGGSALPRYLPVADEMNKYLVENSPCNFSVMSGLSNLTVGSSLVGPAIQLKDCEIGTDKEKVSEPAAASLNAQEAGPQWQDDSLSSLSIESEDDANLLSQAFAAGCNRPKSNLGFSSTTLTTFNNEKRSTSLSVSQPMAINLSHHKGQIATQSNINVNGNESFSSVDSCDSNDNQTKSLLELCILTGKNKGRSNNIRQHQHHQHHHHNQQHHHHHHHRNNASTQSNPNLKQFDSLPLQLNVSAMLRPKHSSTTASSSSTNRHLRDREKNDDKLLLECINTGITSKIVGSGSSSLKNHAAKAFESLNNENRLHGLVGSECSTLANCLQPKNVQATSAVALNVEEVEAVSLLLESNSVTKSTNNTIAATSGVGQKQKENTIPNKISNNNNNNSTQDDIIIGVAVNQATVVATMFQQQQEDVALDEVNLQNQKLYYTKTNDTGFNETLNTLSDDNELDNTNSSDGSNESFIIETTVSLVEQPIQQRQNISKSAIVEKHKDPELMLRSVERLTLEFVSSAEQLRTNNSSEYAHEKRNGSISIAVSGAGGASNSNNTWNEDTHPNDVSFPSVSVTAPFVDSFTADEVDEVNEDEITEADSKNLNEFLIEMTPTNELQPQDGFITTQPLSLDNEPLTLQSIDSQINTTDGNSNNSISFQLGGAVQTAAATMQPHHSNHSYIAQAHNMTNSTLIANEARALAENLLLRNNELEYNNEEVEGDFTFSLNSLDLDNIRPPSGMESLNASGYFSHEHIQIPTQATTQPNSLQKYAQHSPQFCGKSPKFPRKALPANLVARRALGQLNGSVESVNSSCNLLDNIKPPSLMDELLDSMISVASIQSEVADGNCESMATTISVSNYETATADDFKQKVVDANDFDDNTVTLHSCCDLTWQCDVDDDGDDDQQPVTPLPRDENFSSAESTPKKSLLESPNQQHRRSLTPKMKRKLAKDRFKTYTITSITDTNISSLANENEIDEMLQIEVIETSPRSSEGGSVQRRRTSQARYQTQTITYNANTQAQALSIENENEELHISLSTTDECLSDDMSSIKALTKRFTYITETTVLNQQPPENFTEQAQNSETESCHAAEDLYIEENESESEEPTKVTTAAAVIKIPNEATPEQPTIEQIKVVRGRKKPTYISPYSKQYQRSNTAPVTRLTTNKTNSNNLINGGATFLRKRNTNASTSCLNTKSALKKEKKTKNSLPNSPSKAPLERQGTFVKDEPTLAHTDMPIVETTAHKSLLPVASPKRSPISKLPTKRLGAATTGSPQKTTNIAKISTTQKVNSIISKPLRSNSNTNIRTTSNMAAMRMARVSTTTPPSRSNSNLTKIDAVSKINQAQSRIAGIWKRVNEAKSNTKSNVANTTTTTATTSNLKATHTKSSTSIHTQKQQQLVRSSTFDNIKKPTIAIQQKKIPQTIGTSNVKTVVNGTTTKNNVPKINGSGSVASRLEKPVGHK